MSIISSIGLSSGIDYDQLISSLLQIQRQPITRLQNRQTEYNNKISSYTTFSTKLSALKSAADNLRTSVHFNAKTVSVSDSTVLDATVSSAAAVGSYSVGVHSIEGKIILASEEKEVHSGVASSTASVNSSGSDRYFQYTYSGTQQTLTVADGTTLEELRDLINDNSGNPGVTATILYDGSSYRLVMTGDESGSTKNITIDAGTTLDGTGGTLDFRSTTFTQTKTARDAKFSVDGLDISRSSNTITDVMSGVTFTLKNEATSSVTLAVIDDTDTINERIQSFVSAYNDVVSYVSTNSTYDTTNHTSGSLFGESTSRNIINRLRSMITSRVTGLPEDLRALAQIGISTNRDGTLSLDTDELNEQLTSDLEGVANIFTGSTSGIANQIYDYIDTVTDSIDGSVTIRKNTLTDLVEDISDDIRNLESRLDRTEENLRSQFAVLESLLDSLTSQGSFLTNQITLWSK